MLQVFRQGVQSCGAADRFPELRDASGDVESFLELLYRLSEVGSAEYQGAKGGAVRLSSFDEWLNLFAARVLDRFSERASVLLVAGWRGDAESQAAGEVYRDFLQYHLPEVLRIRGFEPVQAFPMCGARLDPQSMRVLRSENVPALNGQVMSVLQYGIVRAGKVFRQALVTTG